MTAQHTKGPWSVVGADWSETGNVRYELGGIEIIRKADARLIAAAPALLEALQWVKSQGFLKYSKRIVGQNESFCDGIDKALDAIKKATGEA